MEINQIDPNDALILDFKKFDGEIYFHVKSKNQNHQGTYMTK